jgi:hypothetical protein
MYLRESTINVHDLLGIAKVRQHFYRTTVFIITAKLGIKSLKFRA